MKVCVKMTDEEALAAGWTRIDPPEKGTYDTYYWRKDDIRMPFLYKLIEKEDAHPL